MRRNCTYFSFKIYQLKCTIERCNFQILDGLECSNPTHVNADHSRHPSEGIVTLVWAKIVFSGQCLLPNCHSCSLYLLKIVNDPLTTIVSTPPNSLIFSPNHPHQQWIVAFCLILHSLALSKRNATASRALLPMHNFSPPSICRRTHS